MGFEGKKINDKLALFGGPLPEKALEALKRRSPTAEDIIKSLPESAFINISQEEILPQEEVADNLRKEKSELLKEKAAYRRERKKKQVAITQEKTIIENIIESPIEEKAEEDMDSLEKELEELNRKVEEQRKAKEELERLKRLQEEATSKVEVVAEAQVAPEPQATNIKDQVVELLALAPNAPKKPQIDAWKERYGRNGVHVMAFGEGEVYVYHHLTRGEWKKIKDIMGKLQETGLDGGEIEERMKEKVVQYCVLWPEINDNWLSNCKAGILDSLYQMILLNSGFLTPQQAMLLTTQL
jgi:hypothetical protein